jgi:hypothetical protein
MECATMTGNVSRRELISTLRQSGLVSEEAEAQALGLFNKPLEDASMPWFVGVLQGAGGWTSAFLVLFGILVTFGQGVGFVGLPLCWVGLTLERKRQGSPFLSQLSISFILLGTGLSVFGLQQLTDWLIPQEPTLHEQVWLMFSIVVCGVVNHLTTGRVTRIVMTISILLSVVFLASLLFSQQASPRILSIFLVVYASMTASLLLYEAKARIKLGSRFESVLSALIAVMVLGLSGEVSLRSVGQQEPSDLLMLSLGLTALVAWSLWVVLAELRHNIKDRQRIIVLATVILVSMSLYLAPGAIFALLLLVLGQRAGSRVLLGVAIAALVISLSHFYYLLQFSLLLKSLALAVSGGLMLVVGRRLSKLSVT